MNPDYWIEPPIQRDPYFVTGGVPSQALIDLRRTRLLEELPNFHRCGAKRRDGQKCMFITRPGEYCHHHAPAWQKLERQRRGQKQRQKLLRMGRASADYEQRRAHRRFLQRQWRRVSPWWPGTTIVLPDAIERQLAEHVFNLTHTPLAELPCELQNQVRWWWQRGVVDGRPVRAVGDQHGEQAMLRFLRSELPRRMAAAGPCPDELRQHYPFYPSEDG